MKKLLLMLSLLLGIVSPSFGQKDGKAQIDSLLNVLHTAVADTDKVNILNEISWLYSGTVADYGKAKEYAHQALLLSEKIKFKIGLTKAYSRIGMAEWHHGNYPEAIKYHSISLEMSKEMGFKRGIAASTINIGLIYYEQGNYPEALNYYLTLRRSQVI